MSPVESIVEQLRENRRRLITEPADWEHHWAIRDCLQIEGELLQKLTAEITVEVARKGGENG